MKKTNIDALKTGLGNPSEIMSALYFNADLQESYRTIFVMGIKEYLLAAIHNDDYSFDEKTLLIPRNIELIKLYTRYMKSIGFNIDACFANQLGACIHSKWSIFSTAPMEVIKKQVLDIISMEITDQI